MIDHKTEAVLNHSTKPPPNNKDTTDINDNFAHNDTAIKQGKPCLHCCTHFPNANNGLGPGGCLAVGAGGFRAFPARQVSESPGIVLPPHPPHPPRSTGPTHYHRKAGLASMAVGGGWGGRTPQTHALYLWAHLETQPPMGME